jgi:hypothetical protein
MIIILWHVGNVIIGEKGQADEGYICLKKPFVVLPLQDKGGRDLVQLRPWLGDPTHLEVPRSMCMKQDVHHKDLLRIYQEATSGIIIPKSGEVIPMPGKMN